MKKMKEREEAKENFGAVKGEAVCYGSQLVSKSAIYALLLRQRKCRDLRALGAKKNCEFWVPSQKNRNSSPGLNKELAPAKQLL